MEKPAAVSSASLDDTRLSIQLFTAISPHLAEMQNPGDVYFNAQGYEFLGQTVAASLVQALK